MWSVTTMRWNILDEVDLHFYNNSCTSIQFQWCQDRDHQLTAEGRLDRVLLPLFDLKVDEISDC